VRETSPGPEQKLRIEAGLLDIRKPEDIAPAFEAAASKGAGALLVGMDALAQENRALIVRLAAEHRLPTVYGAREFVDAGGLLVYGPNYPDQYSRAARYVDKIFRGASPSDLPVEQPTRFELVINLKAAKAMGLTIPESFLLRADEVIE